MVGLGDTFLFAGSSKDVLHLWVIVTEPEPVTGLAVMVNLTTRRSYSDTTVVLNRGDHPFVEHETVVNYSDAKFVNAKDIEKLFGSVCKRRDPMKPDVLGRIRNGLMQSQRTRNAIKEYCRGGTKTGSQ